MSPGDALAGVLIAVVVALLAFHHKPATTTTGADPVPTSVNQNFVAPKEKADGQLTIHDALGHVVHASVARGRVWQTKEQRLEADGASLKLEYQRDVHFIDPYPFDFGTVAGYAGLSGADRFQVGLRWSPVRLLNGTLAPDAIVTKDAVGLGVSAYLPPEYFPWASHWGLEVGRLVPTHHGTKPENFIGVAFSTYSP